MASYIPRVTKDYLVSLVNAKEGLTIDHASATIGEPTVLDAMVDDLTSPTARNTQVVISVPASESSPALSISTQYNRLRMVRLFDLRSTTFDFIEGKSSLSDYLTEISDRVGALITEEDIIDTSVGTPTSGMPTTIALTATANTLNFIGTVNLKFSVGGEVEDDDMHYLAAPGSISHDVTGEETVYLTGVYFTIDAGCGTPLRLMNSHPTSEEVLTVSDLSELTLVNLTLSQGIDSGNRPMVRYGLQGNVTSFDSGYGTRTYQEARQTIDTTYSVDVERTNAGMFFIEFNGELPVVGAGPTEILMELSHPSIPKPIFLSMMIPLPY